MNENIMAGVNNHPSGGYSLGNEFDYKKMVRQRSEALVISLTGKQHSLQWWHSYNKAFEMSPNEMWEQDYRTVYNYLMGHASGNFS